MSSLQEMINRRNQEIVINAIEDHEKNEIVNAINDMNDQLRIAIDANKKILRGKQWTSS